LIRREVRLFDYFLIVKIILKITQTTITHIITVEAGCAKLRVSPNPYLFGRNILLSIGL